MWHTSSGHVTELEHEFKNLQVYDNKFSWLNWFSSELLKVADGIIFSFISPVYSLFTSNSKEKLFHTFDLNFSQNWYNIHMRWKYETHLTSYLTILHPPLISIHVSLSDTQHQTLFHCYVLFPPTLSCHMIDSFLSHDLLQVVMW